MSKGFPRDGVCERCTTDYTRYSARSKYCTECRVLVVAERKRKATLDNTDIPFLEWEEGVEYPSMCDECPFVGYCNRAVKENKELPCFPNHVNHLIWKEIYDERNTEIDHNPDGNFSDYSHPTTGVDNG